MGILSSKKELTIYMAGLPDAEVHQTRLQFNPETGKHIALTKIFFYKENYKNLIIDFIEKGFETYHKESIKNLDALIYVVDSSNEYDNITESANLLREVFKTQNLGENSPVLIIGSCRNKDKSLSEVEIIEKMKLYEIIGRDWKLVLHSVYDKDYNDDLDWIINHIV